MGEAMGRWGGGLGSVLRILGITSLLFLYLPMVVLIFFSFSAGRTFTFPIVGYTTQWYVALAENSDLLRSLKNSFFVAAGVVPLTLLLGIPAAYALSRIPFRGRGVLEHVFMLPLMIPGLITGLSILLLLKEFNLGLSLFSVVLGHTVAWLPVVIAQVTARLRGLDPRLEEASQDLGAGTIETFLRVVLPNLTTAIVGSALLVFILSFDEIAITFMLTGTENTLPMYIWASLRRGVSPELCAVAALMVAASICLVFAGLRFSKLEAE
ncbi:ABC transporter permease [Mesorhizobium sp. M1348]|uniref:ABC transporter permease n=1 Tax=Mesorhizobium sp. M1348 TaxID=2957089 RepID=UPI00333D7CF4